MDKAQSSKLSAERADRQKYHREHLLQYALLAVVFIFSLAILIQLTEMVPRLLVICVLSAFYLGWGVWHHWEEKNLTRAHVLEYLLISTLIFVVLAFVFLGI